MIVLTVALVYNRADNVFFFLRKKPNFIFFFKKWPNSHCIYKGGFAQHWTADEDEKEEEHKTAHLWVAYIFWYTLCSSLSLLNPSYKNIQFDSTKSTVLKAAPQNVWKAFARYLKRVSLSWKKMGLIDNKESCRS